MHVKIGSTKAAPAKPKIMAPNVGGKNIGGKLGKSNSELGKSNTELGKSNAALKEKDASMAQNMETEATQEAKEIPLVSCYRSSGAMPIPRQAAVNKNPPKWSPKVPPKIPTLNIKTHTEGEEDVTEETAEEFMSEELDMSEAGIEEVQDGDFHVAVVREVNVLEEPQPPPKPKQNNCKKHSRCHCDLLSLDTTEFFTIQV